MRTEVDERAILASEVTPTSSPLSSGASGNPPSRRTQPHKAVLNGSRLTAPQIEESRSRSVHRVRDAVQVRVGLDDLTASTAGTGERTPLRRWVIGNLLAAAQFLALAAFVSMWLHV